MTTTPAHADAQAELQPCPHCGKHDTLQIITGAELMSDDQEFWAHSESFAVVCSAATPGGKGGCGAIGGFMPTAAAAAERWNRRATPAVPAPAAPAEPVTAWLLHKDGRPYTLMFEKDERSAGIYSWTPLVAATAQPALAPVALTDSQILAAWGDRSDGPPNRQIISFGRAVLALAGTAAPVAAPAAAQGDAPNV